MEKYLNELIENNRKIGKLGKVASYIPALAKGNSNDLGVAIVDMENNLQGAGEYNKKFTIQSISKVVTLIIALIDKGPTEVYKKVNVEPTGEGFNSIVYLETKDTKRPYNPMINAGAIVTTSLIEGKSEEEKLEKILSFLKKVTDNEDIGVNEEVYLSEKETGARNRALAYFMQSNGILEGDIEEILDLYFRHCSIEATARDLAKFSLVLANDGIIPWNGERIISKEICKIVKAIMVTCGMYDASGKFAVEIGVPAKSGVGGGIMAVVSKRYGIGIYGPSLDDKGNSISGIALLKELSKSLDLSIF